MDALDHEPRRTALSIAFSAEELAALTTLLGLPSVPGVDTAPMTAETLAAARRSLRARGVLAGPGDASDGDPGPPGTSGEALGESVATAVADLLLIATAPQAVLEISVLRPTAPAGRARRYALTPPAGIDQADEDGVIRFTPFAAVDVLVRLADLTGLTEGATGPDGRLPANGFTVPEDMLRLAVDASDTGRAAGMLVAAGLTSAEAAQLAAVIHDRERVVSVRVRKPTGPGRVEGMDAHWAATTQGVISWPVGARERATDPWHRPDGPVTIRPLDIRAVLGDIAVALTGERDVPASAPHEVASGAPVDGP